MTIKRAVLILVFLMIFVIFIQWLIGYLQYGQIIITTNNPDNSITLTSPITHPGSTPVSEQAHGSLSARLKVGSYIVTVGKNSSATSQYVTVSAHYTRHVFIKVVNIGGVEPVTYDNAADIVASSSNLLYLDPTDSGLNDINNQNIDNETGTNYGLQSISWASTSFGIGQTKNGQLYAIQNGSISPLKSPVSNQNDQSLVYTVAPNDEIYIGLGSSVYAGTVNGNFKVIYNHRPSGTFLSPGLNRVTIVDTGYSGSPVSLVTIPSSGKQVTYRQNTAIDAWSPWSPGNKYIVVNGVSTGEVLNSSMKQIATIPQADFSSLAWLNDDTLFYSVSDQLWSYNVSTQKSQVIATMPNNDQVQALSVSADGAYVYILTTYSQQGTMVIERVGLRGQQVSNAIYNLQDFLLNPPAPGSGYAIGLINFSGKPAVQVVLSDDSNSVNSLQSARQVLQEDGFNLNDFDFSVVQGD